ncbi:hypothetical protein OHA70_05580 [Kribbella sp. NBC_00382]|uniref:hypothetical protein n=1 Tax=Kribbella sp. NBC_00382 TaxID=2975967 RepID=UPI002E24AF47
MKLQRLAVAVAGAGMLAATAASGPALATTQNDPTPSWAQRAANAKQSAENSKKSVAAEAECVQSLVFPEATNVTGTVDVTPAKPPRVTNFEPFNLAARYTATWYAAANASGTQYFAYGVFLQGDNLYRHTTVLPATQAENPRTTTVKIGSGWGSFKAIATSNYNAAKPAHSYLYGLNTNGKLYRYAKNGAVYTYKALGNFGGFASFKTLAVISETATYDTLLMTTKAGALYTIRIPITASAKPVVKVVRASGWSAYESLAVQACGNRGGTLVIGVDHDTNTGFQYAFAHATGKSTVITSYGKVPAVLDGLNHAPFTWYQDNLTGE